MCIRDSRSPSKLDLTAQMLPEDLRVVTLIFDLLKGHRTDLAKTQTVEIRTLRKWLAGGLGVPAGDIDLAISSVRSASLDTDLSRGMSLKEFSQMVGAVALRRPASGLEAASAVHAFLSNSRLEDWILEHQPTSGPIGCAVLPECQELLDKSTPTLVKMFEFYSRTLAGSDDGQRVFSTWRDIQKRAKVMTLAQYKLWCRDFELYRVVSRANLGGLFERLCASGEEGISFVDFKQLLVPIALQAFSQTIGANQSSCTRTLFEHMSHRSRACAKCGVPHGIKQKK
eukprot:TRINITY_DN16173_c0_g2_i1.p1 TRINITY_DN16173_c0_g2~~TRINITY_DN16173_c0_g2_i1.p1  ORF type:complete len:284 (+),score=52.77 TRINITY_DN16173_c0_g2_i1:151-1002(+)